MLEEDSMVQETIGLFNDKEPCMNETNECNSGKDKIKNGDVGSQKEVFEEVIMAQVDRNSGLVTHISNTAAVGGSNATTSGGEENVEVNSVVGGRSVEGGLDLDGTTHAGQEIVDNAEAVKDNINKRKKKQSEAHSSSQLVMQPVLENVESGGIPHCNSQPCISGGGAQPNSSIPTKFVNVL